jgi:hypothetical protein
MQTLDLTNKNVTIKECDSVPEMFVAGPVNSMRTGPLVTVTLTNVRADVVQLLSGSTSPDLTAVVVARLVMPVATAEQLVRALGQVINPGAGGS